MACGNVGILLFKTSLLDLVHSVTFSVDVLSHLRFFDFKDSLRSLLKYKNDPLRSLTEFNIVVILRFSTGLEIHKKG